MQIPEAVRPIVHGTSFAYVVTHTILSWPWGTFASIAATILSVLGICDWVTRKVKERRAKRRAA